MMRCCRSNFPTVFTRLILALGVATATATAAMSASPETVDTISKPLLAYWTFDDGVEVTCRDVSGRQRHAAWKTRPATARMVRGVFSQALDVSGSHQLRMVDGNDFHDVKTISLSAWTRPIDLSVYREIFRKEDGDERILFSFQHNGTILSLGLNINGYVECDAKIDPSQVLDGFWHHCAATFDGRDMRVYLDGREVGQLHRPGDIRATGRAAACIGSSNGGECYQGSLDDLRIYRDALTADEVRTLYRGGLLSMEVLAKQLERKMNTLEITGDTFAEVFSNLRRKLISHGIEQDRELVGVFLARLRLDYPDECERFTQYTEKGLLKCLLSGDRNALRQEASRLMDLLLEYRPLTTTQWASQTPDELAKWKEVDSIHDRYQRLLDQSEAAEYSPEWIDVILDAGRRIDFRPRVQEAVAPYRRPETPPTRNLSNAEARERLERDWLFQADGKPTGERIRLEIAWTRQLARRMVEADQNSVDLADLSSRLQQLDAEAASVQDVDASLYFRVRRLKRKVIFHNPVLDFDEVLFVDMPFPQGSEWPHETRHRLGYMAVPGARLLVLKGLSPSGSLRQLMPEAPLHGSFWRPDVSYDAKRVVFCFKPHNEKSFHLYEIQLDGTGLVQLTDGPYDDLDPIYTADDERIIFSTTRGHTYVRCMPPTNAFVLARCDRNGDNLYLISRNNEPDYLPSVMNDGRIIYTRWEYTDKPLWRAQSLWTVNPDGTQVNTFWGNQSVWPDLLKDARSIPGSHRVMFTGSAHHNWFSGSVGIIDPEKGFNFPDGLTKVTADVAWPECGNGPVDPVESPTYHASGRYSAYYSPYPLSERDFLVSANRDGKFLLYLMDIDGNRELIYEGVHNIFHAIPIRRRHRPKVVPDRVIWPRKNDELASRSGIIYSYNIYEGTAEELRNKVKYLRVLNIEPKTYTYWYKRPYISTGPVVSMVQSEGVKRILGTVPIEPDGSVAFHAPAGTALHFQLLDDQYRALQTMRSFTGVMPGETRGCLGCHESHSRVPHLDAAVMALSKPPQDITPPPWGDQTVSFPRFVQPVLDKYCGKCHEGDGDARKTLDLTSRPGFLIFNEPYVTLIGRPTWGQPYAPPPQPIPGFGIAKTLMVEAYGKTDPHAYQTPEPMTALSYKSPLIEIASSGKHYDVRVDPVSRRQLIAWIDTMCPYRGAEEVRALDDPDFQGIDWLAVRPKIKTAPKIVRPGPFDGRSHVDQSLPNRVAR